jgi:hypothetical protein
MTAEFREIDKRLSLENRSRDRSEFYGIHARRDAYSVRPKPIGQLVRRRTHGHSGKCD